jgi:hypothetical protein
MRRVICLAKRASHFILAGPAVEGQWSASLTVDTPDCHAGIYQITGKQQAATSGITDIVAAARGAGIAASEWVRDEAHFDTLVDRRFDDGGPSLLAVKIDDAPGQGQTPRDPALIRSRFMKGLGTGRGGGLET